MTHLGCSACKTLWSYGDRKVIVKDAYGNTELVCEDCRNKVYRRFKRATGYATSKLEVVNDYGSYYMKNYEGTINLFVDNDGTDYSVNLDQAQADFHYKWSQGDKGIGYYLQDTGTGMSESANTIKKIEQSLKP